MRSGGQSRVARSEAVRVEIVGLREFERDLARYAKQVDNLLPAYRKVAEMLRDRAKAAAPGSVQSAIQKRATPTSAAIQIIHRPARALGVFMGANRRFGWYSSPQFQKSSGRQFEKWVGNQWVPGSQSGKPYYIGDAVNESVDEAMDLLLDEVIHLARYAYPKLGGASITP